MASPFQRYQSGIQPVTGMLEAGTNIGNAYLNAGSAIAENINKYFETKAKNDVITGQGEQLAQSLTGYYNVLSKDPEFQQYAEQFIKPTLDSLSNLHELNFNKKAGVVAGAQARYQDMANSLNLYQKMKDMELKRRIAEGERNTPKVKATGEKPAVAVTRWNPYKSGIENFNDFKTQLQNARKAGFKGDDNAAIINWLDSLESDVMDGTFEGLSPEQSHEMRGFVVDQIYALRAKIDDEMAGLTPSPELLKRTEATAKSFFADRGTGVENKTVVTDANGNTRSVTLPDPAMDLKVNRGPIPRIVNTPRGLVRVEVNQAFPDDMIVPEGMNLDALKNWGKTPSNTQTAKTPETLPTPPSKENKGTSTPPASLPSPAATVDKSAEIQRLTEEQNQINATLQGYYKDADKNQLRVLPDDAEALRLKYIENSKRLAELAGRNAEDSAPAAVEPSKKEAAPESLPTPPSATTTPSAPTPQKTEAKKPEQQKPDSSTVQFARSLGVPVEELDKNIKESGLAPFEFYKDIREGAEQNGITPSEYYKGIYATAEEALPPPPSKQAESTPAPEGLPEPETPAPRRPIPGSREAKELTNTRYIEAGAYDDGQGKIRYEIQTGDNPARIAKKFGLSQKKVEDLMKADGLNPSRLQVGNTFSLSDYEQEGSASYEPDESSSDASTESTSDAPPETATVGLEVKPSKAKTPEEELLVRQAWGQDITSTEREIEATKRAKQGLQDYLDSLLFGEAEWETVPKNFNLERFAKERGTSVDLLIQDGERRNYDARKLKAGDRFIVRKKPVPYYGAPVNMMGGWWTDEDYHTPEFDSEFPDKGVWSGDEAGYGWKGGFNFDNRLKETQAYKDSAKVILDLQKEFSYNLWQGGTVGKLAFGEPWGVKEKIKAKELIAKQIAALDASLPTLEKKLKTTRSTPPSYADVKAKAMGETNPDAVAQLPEIAPLMGEVKTTVGTKETSVDYTQEERKERLKAYLMEKYKDSEGRSYIPSGFDAIYNALHPEANLKIIDTPIGPMYWDGNSYKQAQQTSKGMTTQDIREAKRGVFGTQTEKGWIPEELGEGTGVYLAGLFNRSDADLAKFDEMAQNNAQALAALRGIKEVLRIPLHSIPIGKKRAEAFGRVQAYIASLKAAMRTDIVGVGTVSNFEQAMIAKAVPDPSEFWRLDDADWGRIYEIEKRLKNQLINTGAMKGVTVMIKEPEAEKDVESALRAGNKRLK